MMKIEEQIPKKTKTLASKSSLWPDQKRMTLKLWSIKKRITDTTSGKYVIKIPSFDSVTPEEWIIFLDLIQNSLVRQNITADPPMYMCMVRVLKGDAKAEYLQQANLVSSWTVTNFTTVMSTMTVHIFPTYTYCDQR